MTQAVAGAAAGAAAGTGHGVSYGTVAEPYPTVSDADAFASRSAPRALVRSSTWYRSEAISDLFACVRARALKCGVSDLKSSASMVLILSCSSTARSWPSSVLCTSSLSCARVCTCIRVRGRQWRAAVCACRGPLRSRSGTDMPLEALARALSQVRTGSKDRRSRRPGNRAHPWQESSRVQVWTADHYRHFSCGLGLTCALVWPRARQRCSFCAPDSSCSLACSMDRYR